MRHSLFLLLLFLISSCIAQSHYADVSTPYAAIRTHLDNLQPTHYNDSIAAMPFLNGKRSLPEAKNAAIKLKRVLDGKGIYVYTDEVPKSSNYYDSATRKHRYVLASEYPKIFLRKAENGNWYFSDSSIDEINLLYQQTFRFGTGRLINLLPRLGTKQLFGLYTYQYIAIFLLALISAIVYRLFTFVTERIISRVLKRLGYKGDTSEKYLWLIAKPTSVFIIVLLLLLFAPALQLPVSYSKYVNLILRVMVPLFGTVILYRLVNIVSEFLFKLAATTESNLDDQLVPLVRKTLKTFVVIIGTLFILDNLDIPILPLLTGLSIGGLAFALAAQDTIKNFFGSIMIFVDKPFQVGDWITTNDADGTVEEVGFRSSRIRTFRNSLIYVPNGRLADNTIDNHGRRHYRRFYTQIAINYDTPPELIEVFVQGLRKIVLEHPDTWKDNYHIYFNDMADSSLNIMFYIFFEVPNWGEELRARHEVLLHIVSLAKELGVNFAFPTQTLHVENVPGQPSLSPSYMSRDEAYAKMQAFKGGRPATGE